MAVKIALGAALAVIFAITVLILLGILHGPLKSTDYLVIGTLATLVCLLVLFIVNLAMDSKNDLLFKRRK